MKSNKARTLAALLALTALGNTPPALAGETVEFDNGAKFDWRLNTSYTLSTRLKAPDSMLKADSSSNDGNNNFDKGSLTSHRIGALLETKLSRGESGLVVSGSAFFDKAYHGGNDNNAGSGLPDAGFNPNGVNKAAPFNQFTPEARRYHGGYARFLDAYGYTAFTLGDGGSRATLRLGRHVVAWGEGLFFPGISLAQGPADGTKTGVPGTETKDQLLPEDQLSLAIEVTPRWSLLAHAQFNFHPILAPAPGSFMSTSDSVGAGAVCLGPFASLPPVPGAFPSGFTGCSFGNRGPDILPGKTGQWGVGTRFRITDATELGVYYLNVNDRTPLPEINAFAPGTATPAFFNVPGNQIGNGSYRIRYFDDVKLIGATFSTALGPVTVAGEISHKRGAPVLVDTQVDPVSGATIPNPTRANVTQVNLNALVNLGRLPVADTALLLAEVAAVRVGSVQARQAPGVEDFPVFQQAFFAASNQLSFQTEKALAVSVLLLLGYPGVFEDWDLSVPISYAQQIRGRTLVGGVGGEGDKRFSIGLAFLKGGKLSLELNYLGFLGGADVSLKKSRLLADRDQLSLIAKYSY